MTINHAKFNQMALPRLVETTKKWRKRFIMMIAIPPAIMAVMITGIASMEKDATPGAIALCALFMFCFFSLFFLAFAAKGDYLRPIRLFRQGSIAEGRVAKCAGSRNPYINVAFSDSHGKSCTAKISLGILEDRYKVGDHVDVIYDASFPETAIIPREDYFEVSGG